MEKAENCIPELSKENQWEIGNQVYRQMGGTGFSEWDYEKAFEYFDAMLSRAENNTEENDGQVMAEAQYMSGAALVLLDRAEEGKERIEKAVMFYDAYDRSEFYRDAAMAHAFWLWLMDIWNRRENRSCWNRGNWPCHTLHS